MVLTSQGVPLSSRGQRSWLVPCLRKIQAQLASLPPDMWIGVWTGACCTGLARGTLPSPGSSYRGRDQLLRLLPRPSCFLQEGWPSRLVHISKPNMVVSCSCGKFNFLSPKAKPLRQQAGPWETSALKHRANGSASSMQVASVQLLTRSDRLPPSLWGPAPRPTLCEVVCLYTELACLGCSERRGSLTRRWSISHQHSATTRATTISCGSGAASISTLQCWFEFWLLPAIGLPKATEPLPPTGETWMAFLDPGFSLAPVWLLGPFGE